MGSPDKPQSWSGHTGTHHGPHQTRPLHTIAGYPNIFSLFSPSMLPLHTLFSLFFRPAVFPSSHRSHTRIRTNSHFAVVAILLSCRLHLALVLCCYFEPCFVISRKIGNWKCIIPFFFFPFLLFSSLFFLLPTPFSRCSICYSSLRSSRIVSRSSHYHRPPLCWIQLALQSAKVRPCLKKKNLQFIVSTPSISTHSMISRASKCNAKCDTTFIVFFFFERITE